MGHCLSCGNRDPEALTDRHYNSQLKKEKSEAQRVKKILFLGSGGSGKSTIFKQLRQIYGKPLTSLERRQQKTYIHEQCINQMKHALDVLGDFQDKDRLGHQLVHKNLHQYVPEEEKGDIYAIPELSDEGVEAADYIENLHHSRYRLDDDIVSALKTLWKEDAIQRMYELRNITGIYDSSKYFWNMLDEIAVDSWIPDTADLLLVRKRTTGVNERDYEMCDQNKKIKSIFKIVDVGGQKSERKKWIKCFDSVTAVIFVASLSCYDEELFEDFHVNTMTDQLTLFGDIINNPSLMSTSMILFLNKRDLFAEKIKDVPLSTCDSFATYKGPPTSFDQTTKYIRKAFTSLNETPNQRNIFTHVTCATNQDNIEKVFADVQHIVIESSLIGAGLMDWDDDRKYTDKKNDEEVDEEMKRHIIQTIQEQEDHKNRHSDRYNRDIGAGSTAYLSRIASSMNPSHDFREKIKRDSIPHIRTLEYLSVLPQYEYPIIEKGDRNEARFTDDEALLKGKYSWAVSAVPSNVFAAPSPMAGGKGKSDEKEMYLMVDMDIDKVNVQKIHRRRINLAVVLDGGQSMNAAFTDTTLKLEESKKAIVNLLQNELGDEDRFCLVWFDEMAKVVQPMVELRKRNTTELCELILKNILPKIHSLSSTRVDGAGFDLAVQEFRKLGSKPEGKEALLEAENRVIIISALTLNDGTIEKMKAAANAKELNKRVYSTVICNRGYGVGWNRVQSQRETVNAIPGCNFFTLDSSEQLNDRMIERFEETVTPLMFNLSVTVEVPSSTEQCVVSTCRLNTEQSVIDRMQRKRGDMVPAGSGKKKNEILSIPTLFPDTKEWDKDSHNFRYNFRDSHYVLLMRLSMEDMEQRELNIVQRYQSLNGEMITIPSTLSLERSSSEQDAMDFSSRSSEPLMQNEPQMSDDGDYYDNLSIRKAIVVSRYVRMLREWVENADDPRSGGRNLTTNQREKTKARGASIVSSEFQSKFNEFTAYFEREIRELKQDDDEELDRDLNVLKHLLGGKSSTMRS